MLKNLTNRGATPALINTLAFAESRHRMLAENVANWQVPGYKSKGLDVRAFQRQLRRALVEKGSDPRKPLVLDGGREFQSRPNGSLQVTPTTGPPRNLLFHDGTNASIEHLMTDLAQNGITYQTANTILKGYFDGLRKAIRGTV